MISFQSLQDVGGDLRHGLRQLRRTPVVSFVAIATLALGIGANTAIFSLVNNLLLRPMPVRDPHELFLVSVPSVLNDPMLPPEAQSQFAYMWTYAMWEEMRQTPLFAGTLAYFPARFDLSRGGRTDFVSGLWGSGSFFQVLGVAPFLGRTFTEADDRFGGGPDGPVAVISYDLWQRRFGGVNDVIGQVLEADRRRYTIVGVLPKGFFGPVAGRRTDVVIPVGLHELAARDTPQNWLTIIGRLKPGDTPERASTELRSLQTALVQTVHEPSLKNPLILLPAASGNRLATTRYERPLFMMLGVVALVLMITCANIGNLMLARGAVRQHEMSIRSAIGGSRWRLARQVLVESLLLASLGAASGFWLAWWSGPLLANLLAARTNATFVDFSPDSRIIAFTAGVSMFSALLFGAVPALRASHVEPIEALIERAGISASRRRLAHGFVVAQVALSLVLVVGAGLFGRSLSKIVRRDLGFDAHGVMVVNVSAPRLAAGQPPRTIDFEDLVRTVAALPSVDGVALSSFIPIGAGVAVMPVNIMGLPPLPPGENATLLNAIGPAWFSVYRTPLLAGRDFTTADGSRSIAIVNQAFARRFLNGETPIGRIVRRTDTGPGPLPLEFEIVGMTADAVHESLHAPALPMLSFPFAEIGKSNPLDNAFLSIRADRVSPSTLSPAITRAVAARDPDLSLTFESMPDVVSGSIAQDRALAILIGFFGALALLLAALGLYGITSYAVSRRKGEIAIRMALGADRRSVIGLVLSRVAVLVGAGIVTGAAGSLWMSRFAAPLLYDLEPRDPFTLAASMLTLAAVGLFAGWLPAHLASRIDPADALRKI